MAGGRRAAGEKMTGVGPTPTDRYDGLADFYDAQNAGSSESEGPRWPSSGVFTSCGLLIETVEENGDGLVPWRIGIAASKPA